MDSKLDEEKEKLEKEFEKNLPDLVIVSENDVQIGDSLGQGAFGQVFKGKYKENDVAIKQIILEDSSKEVYENLTNEILALQKAFNPFVPKFYGIMKKDKHYHLLFQFIPGKTLKETYPSMTYLEKLKAIHDLCEILENLHEKKLIHRDIKPGNIMVTNDKKVFLIDFGISKIAQHTTTYTKNQIGTVPYMSPEQFQIDTDKFNDPTQDNVKCVPISIRSDIWSLGVMISQIFSGVDPYLNATKKKVLPSQQFITKRLLCNKPFPIPKEFDSMHVDIKAIVEKTTDLNPMNRPSAKEIKEYFAKLIEKENQKPQDSLDVKDVKEELNNISKEEKKEDDKKEEEKKE